MPLYTEDAASVIDALAARRKSFDDRTKEFAFVLIEQLQLHIIMPHRVPIKSNKERR